MACLSLKQGSNNPTAFKADFSTFTNTLLHMLKALSLLIKQRQPFSKSALQVVKVKNVGGGQENQCFNNAVSQIDREKSIKIVSGWIVGKTDIATNSTFLLQHFWNMDADGNYFDTTPLTNMFKYVLDLELMDFGQKHIKKLSSSVGYSLMLKNDIFYSFSSKDSSDSYTPMSSLHSKNLFPSK